MALNREMKKVATWEWKAALKSIGEALDECDGRLFPNGSFEAHMNCVEVQAKRVDMTAHIDNALGLAQEIVDLLEAEQERRDAAAYPRPTARECAEHNEE